MMDKKVTKMVRQYGPLLFISRSFDYMLWDILLQNTKSSARFRYKTSINSLKNWILYDAPPDSYKSINIRPKDHIEYEVNGSVEDINLIQKVSRGGLGQTTGGNWDLPPNRNKIGLHRGNMYFVERFDNNRPIEETHRYQFLVQHKKDVVPDSYNSVNNYVKDILIEYDSLYWDIKNNGYKNNYTKIYKQNRTTQQVRDRLETLVVIGRTGEIYHWDGQHRKGIARALDIEIPAQVVCRHKKWQEFRDEIHNTGLSEDSEQLYNHPDLQDVIS